MRILVTNDDGIDSEGLLALRQALATIGDVVVIAPDHNWSAAGHTKTMHKPLRVSRVPFPDGGHGFACDGTPSDCVALSMLGFVDERPALVVSGINKGANLGGDITYSGTVAAAMEAVVNGVPGIAVSLASYRDWDFGCAAAFAAVLAAKVVDKVLPPDILLNVNVPSLPKDQIRGVQITRLGKRIYRDRLIERQDPFGRSYYWIGGDEPTGHPESGTDIWAVATDQISVTPIHLDLTNHALMDELSRWDIAF